MKEQKLIKKILLPGCFLAALFLMAVFLQIRMEVQVAGAPGMVSEGLTVSPDSGFYKETQLISVKVPRGATVYYTDTGEEPTPENGRLYTEPVSLAVSEEEKVHMYRFKAFYEDGGESVTVNRTFFMGEQVDTRYTTNVLHVAGDPEDLFGYENGIFVAGKTLDEYREQNPDKPLDIHMQANFTRKGEESEREVYIEYFTRDGESLLSQECGIRIFGNVSRIKNMKSFRLYARKEYDVKNEFRYPVLPKLSSLTDGTMASEHKRLIVRSAGTDNGYTFIRSELVGQLASDAGFPDVMYAEPICVYLNGMYYGIYWLQNGFDAGYFANRYGEYEGEFVILDGSDAVKEPAEDPAMQPYVEEYNELYTRFSGMDLTIDENYQELARFLDVENYLQYYAIEYFVGNTDWPQGNVKAYRYVAPDGAYREGTVFDGRYRHLLFDTDFAFGLMTETDADLLKQRMNDRFPLFQTILQRQDCRDYFASYVCDLFNGAMSYANVAETLEKMHNSRAEELYYLLEKTDIPKQEFWVWEDTIQSYEEYLEKQQVILDYVKERIEIVYSDITYRLDYSYGSWYQLNVTKCNQSDVQINTITMEEDFFTGNYIGDIPVVITPVMAKNEVFDYWLVNGEIREEEELILTEEDMIEDEVWNYISVEMIVHNSEEPVLQLNRIRAAGQNDYVEIINLSDKEIETRGYYLSDSEDAYRYALPAAVLAPGETVKYYGKDCTDAEALGQNAMNFNLKTGETLTLTCGEETLEAVVIPDLMRDGVYQRDGDTGRFAEVLSEE